jgi:hypothetical protein
LVAWSIGGQNLKCFFPLAKKPRFKKNPFSIAIDLAINPSEIQAHETTNRLEVKMPKVLGKSFPK